MAGSEYYDREHWYCKYGVWNNAYSSECLCNNCTRDWKVRQKIISSTNYLEGLIRNKLDDLDISKMDDYIREVITKLDLDGNWTMDGILNTYKEFTDSDSEGVW